MTNAFAHIKNSRWFYPILLIGSALAVYSPILGNDFLYYWDDQWVVMNTYTESGLNGHNIWAIFSEFYHGQYAPLNESLYLILYTTFGYKPFWFHLASLLLHAANVLLVYSCIFRLLELSRNIIVEHRKLVAFFTALIFAVHPFNVESVAWMSASKVLVYSFFYLLATYTFLNYCRFAHHRCEGDSPKQSTPKSYKVEFFSTFREQGGKLLCFAYNDVKTKWYYYFLTLFLFACSFLGKEQAVSFPLWMLLIYWLTGYSFKNKKLWFAVAPFLAFVGCIRDNHHFVAIRRQQFD